MRLATVLGALALITIVLVGAFAVVDRRAAEAFKADPLMIRDGTRGASSADARRTLKRVKQFASSQGTPASTIASSARTGTATTGTAAASSLDAEPAVKSHHRRRWHHRR